MLSLERGDQAGFHAGTDTPLCSFRYTVPGSPSGPSPVQQTALSSTSTEALKPSLSIHLASSPQPIGVALLHSGASHFFM